ncbi:MAG: hypothetical protein IJ710_10770 [Prevotella sp.]|nr:hypothetical protein [Prevotella sp.]
MTYDRQILDILLQVGERGLSVQAIAKHVYNQNCSLFGSPVYADVYNYVQQYLLRNSKSAHSLIENAGRRGRYRLNTQGSDDARQLMLRFQEEKELPEKEEKPVDFSLDLFA